MNTDALSEKEADRQVLMLGRAVLNNEGHALLKLSSELEHNGFVDVVRLVMACKGHVKGGRMCISKSGYQKVRGINWSDRGAHLCWHPL